jgi:hypothetical protein
MDLPLGRRAFVRLGAASLLGAGAQLATAAEPEKPVATAGAPAPTAFPGGQTARVRSGYVSTIWADGRHNGFPGIARVGDFYYVAFRSSDSHRAKQAAIRVIRAPAGDLKKWQPVAEFTREHDCRDPLLFENDGKVQLVFHSKEDFYSQSPDGVTWSEPRELETEFAEPRPGSGLVFTSKRRWLFRIRRGPDGAFYSLGRCGIRDENIKATFGLILFRSEDGVKFSPMHTYGEGPTSAMRQYGVGSGWGHEADVAFAPDGTLVAAIRNARDGVVAIGQAPLGPWRAYATGAWTFGGPALHVTKRGGMLLAARDLREPRGEGFAAVCKVWTVTPSGLENPFIVPSGGDCAYQSFADGPGDTILLCYYSSHEWPQPGGVGDNPANIYLAHLSVRHEPAK